MVPCKNHSQESVMEVTPLLDNKKSQRKTFKPSRGRKILIMVSCLWFQMISVGVGFGLAEMYVEMIRVFQASRSDAALIQSIYLGLTTGGGILWTGVARRYGPGLCVIVGATVASAGLFISSFAINLPMVIVFTGVVGGLGMGHLYLGSFITISWTFHENPGVPLVIVTIGSSVGQFVIPYLYEIFISQYGWAGAFQLISGVALNSVIFGVIIFTSRRFYVTGSDDTAVSVTKLCDVTLLKDAMILFILSACLNLATTGPIESWFLADIMVIRGYERETGSLFVTLTGLGNFIGRVIGAFVRFYVKIPTLYHWIYLCLIIAAAHILIIHLFTYWPLFGACFLYGIPFGVTVAQVPAIMFEAAGLSRYPRAIALMNLMYGIGNFCGVILGGFIKDTTGSYNIMFYIAAGSSMYISVATIVVVLLRKFCTSTKTYKHPKVEYSKIEETDREKHTGAVNGSVPRNKLYDSVQYRAEADNIAFDNTSDPEVDDNNFDIDTASIVYRPNDKPRIGISILSKTL